MLVGEIVLCNKESSKRTRIAAFELLVSLARAMHAADPPPTRDTDLDEHMGERHQKEPHMLLSANLHTITNS